MTVATAAITVLPLATVPDSFYHQYLNCGPAMTEALPALTHSELQQNKDFSWVWPKARAEQQRWTSNLSRDPREPDPSTLTQGPAMALTAYTMKDMYEEFNAAVCEAGRSHQQYQDNFHFKMLHFLLTNALGRLRDSRGQGCHNVFQGMRGIWFEAWPGGLVQFSQFMVTSLSEKVAQDYGNFLLFQVHMCHGVDIQKFSYNQSEKEALILPFETFEVTKVTWEGKKVQIVLHSTRNFSNYKWEWLQGDVMGTTWGDG
ncbi:NRT2 ribosyltransferase, partial [Nicator chloris]|nr:NRT2 ribosyltransferase [Nicator chloris]